MIIDETLGIQTIREGYTRKSIRRAVRAIIIQDNKILMVHTNKGDYKFPGGGVKREESKEEALMREVTEETGYIVKCIGSCAGKIVQRYVNQFDSHGIFEMISYYYFCEVKSNTTSQSLEKYEREQEFEPKWIELDKVIECNEGILTKKGSTINPWVYRETLALNKLKEAGCGK